MTVCTDCGGTVIEYDPAAGNGFCVKCGTVVEENTIVSEVTFGETSTGAAMVQGAYVAQGSTHARMSGPFGKRGSVESREQTIANASRKIQSLATALHLSEVVALAATRLYTLAVEHKFTKGRRSVNVAAVCLYVACRQKETRNYMLIDFSDLLQVNVFELGHTYLQLVQTLNLKLPLVDPSHYISRFAALLEFGEETHRVATDAVRLVQRFDRDWVTKGRRPAGICGAALLLAARMNNFRRSVEEIVQVVKIADTTLKKRLEEFKRTPSGALTLADFRTVWLDEEMDPPAFTKGKEREEREREKTENGLRETRTKKRKGMQMKTDNQSEEEGTEAEPSSRQMAPPPPTIDPTLFNRGILVGTTAPPPLFFPEDDEGTAYAHIDPVLRLNVGDATARSAVGIDDTVDRALAEEVATFLQNPQGLMLAEALDEAEERRLAQFAEVDELKGLDEEELDRFLLPEDEVKIKERVWVEMNREYLEGIATKADQLEGGTQHPRSRKVRLSHPDFLATASIVLPSNFNFFQRRKTVTKPRDESTPSGRTAAESVRNLLRKNAKYSKRINYDALKDLFVDGGNPSINFDDKDDLYSMDDKAEEGVLVEEGGGVASQKSLRSTSQNDFSNAIHGGEPEDESEKGDNEYPYVGWDDAYEQEV